MADEKPPSAGKSAAVQAADLRGGIRLATSATLGLTDLIEAVHQRIARVPLLGKPAADGRTAGLTGLVYRSVRGATRLVGGSTEALLGLLAPVLLPHPATADGAVAGADSGAEPPAISAEREAVLAATNGVLGDHLAATANPLAINMTFRRDGQALLLERSALAQRLPQATGRVLVLLHGLCMNDLQWRRDGHDHGAMLAQSLGMTPVYLHYNSGRHISQNGAELAGLLQRLVDQWSQPIERLVLMGHSMGGLVARSALQAGAAAGQAWVGRVNDLVCLGSPHHGATLEKAGHWLDMLLGATAYSAPFARLGQLRSAGITDLRHGNVQDADWQGLDRFADGDDHRQHLPLPTHIRCYAAAGCLGQASEADLSWAARLLRHQPDGNNLVSDRLVGDGLVPVDSALGRHRDAQRCLAFQPDRQWVGQDINHMQLLSHPDVAAQLLRWLA